MIAVLACHFSAEGHNASEIKANTEIAKYFHNSHFAAVGTKLTLPQDV